MSTSGMKALETMQLHYHDRELSARKWKEAGGKVVGYSYTGVPVELIIAAGLLPLMITGDPEISTEAGDKYMEDYFCPFVRSVHNLFVTGKYSFLDLAVFPHTNHGCKHGCATCKPAIIRRLRKKQQAVVYVGDGLSDRFAVEEADVVFAKHELLAYCRKRGLACRRFETFGDVQRELAGILGDESPALDAAVGAAT